MAFGQAAAAGEPQTFANTRKGVVLMPLMTKAEREAECARGIDGFKGLALEEVRDRVAAILRLIGRVKGIFSTCSVQQ